MGKYLNIRYTNEGYSIAVPPFTVPGCRKV